MLYADDITLVSGTAAGLQSLINICTNYAKKWRFRFGLAKSQCMITGPKLFETDPTWTLYGSDTMLNVSELDVLGVTFDSKGNCHDHISNRIRKCRSSFYALLDSGMSYPGASVEVKCHLWNTICLPYLLYGMECVSLNGVDVHRMNSLQGALIKQSLGIPKRYHHTKILTALNIPRVECIANQRLLSLFYNIFKVNTPLRTLYSYFIAKYLVTGKFIRDTMVGRIINMGISPLSAAFNKLTYTCSNSGSEDGVADSLQYMIMSEQFLKPYSDEHVIVKLLTKCF